jgi:hypothetical protein
MSVGQSLELLVLGETCNTATLSTTNPIWLEPGSNPGRSGGKPAANQLSYGMVLRDVTMCALRQKLLISLSSRWKLIVVLGLSLGPENGNNTSTLQNDGEVLPDYMASYSKTVLLSIFILYIHFHVNAVNRRQLLRHICVAGNVHLTLRVVL